MLPVGQAGGEIPIPINLRVFGQFKTQVAELYHQELDITGKPKWIPDGSSDAIRPAYATVHLGYIAPAAHLDGSVGSEIIVLEDGTQFRTTDFVAFTDWNESFTLPEDFRFPAKNPANVLVATLGSHALYSADAAGLGSTWQARIAGLSPTGYGTIQSNYRLLMDRDRARVLVQLPDSKLWVPILWVDRFGHWVSLKWQKETQGLYGGVTARQVVEVKNQRGQGVLLQWADFADQNTVQDLLVADPIGMGDAVPSILVQGYPGASSMRPVGWAAGNPITDLVVGRVAGVVGRPTRVQIGYVPPTMLPVWGSSGSVQGLRPPPPESIPPLRSWSFAWDANRAAIQSMTDALGVVTTFHYGLRILPTTQTQWYLEPNDDLQSKYKLGDLSIWAINRTDSYDSRSGKTLSRTWTPYTISSGEPTVALREAYGDPANASRFIELSFAKSTDAWGRDYGNGAPTRTVLWEAGKSTPTAMASYTLQGAGLDGSFSRQSGGVIERNGEPKQTIAVQFDPLGMLESGRTVFAGVTPVKMQETASLYEAKKEKLIPGRPTQVTVTRYAANGVAIAPAVVTKTEYDPTTGLPSKAYRAVGAGQQGNSYNYDTEGRLNLQMPLSDIPFTLTPFQTIAYDPTSGLPTSKGTSYAPAGSSTRVTLSRTFSNHDGVGRPRTIQDERGLITTLGYDIWGRVTKATPPAGASTYFGFPDEWTRVITLGSATTIEYLDGFGHLMSRTLPDGSREEISYDEFGRQEAVVRISNDGSGQRRNAAQTLYDALDRPTTITSPGGASQGLSYVVDPAYPLWSRSTQNLNTPGTVSSSQEYRDALGQVVRQVSPAGDVTVNDYDGAGALLKVTLSPAGGGAAQVREFKYDAGGRMKERIEPETGTTFFQNFNPFGQPTTITEAEGRSRTLGYDGLGRLVSMTGGSEASSYTYSGLDLASSSSSSNGAVVNQRFEYNGPGKQLSLEETIQPGLVNQISYSYDPGTALMSAITYPSGRYVVYTRDALGRITGITQNGSPVVTGVGLNEWGDRKRLSFASGAYSEWNAKDFGVHLDTWNIGYKTSGGAAATDGSRTYAYDSAERLVKAGDWNSLTHDVQGRVTAASSSSLALGTTQSHDGYGNNMVHSVSGAGLGAVPANALNPFAFNPMPDNRVPGMQANGASISGWAYNGRGEATSVGVATGSTQAMGLAWDGLGRLRAVSYGGGTQSYLYSPSGMRVASMDSSSALGRRYAYTNSGLLLSEYGEAGAQGLMATMAPTTSKATKTTKPTNVKHTAKGLAYILPPDGEDPPETGAWINQPSGPTTVTVGQAVNFAGGTDYGTSLRWTFGDGASAIGGSSSHAYAAAGTYTVIFRATRAGYLASTATVQITVVAAAGPRINAFSASATTLGEGNGTYLSWNVSNATTINITGLGNVAASGTVWVAPTTTTTYLLTASGSGSPATAIVQITVVPAPVIAFFVGEPAQIQKGQAATLKWNVYNATAYSLNQGIGTVPGTWASVWPENSTTFTLTATNTQNGISVTRTASTTVTVGAASNAAWKRDVVYLGDEAVAEIDAAGVHELHNDHLGSPTLVTNGYSAQIEGRQVFGPYGERVKIEGYQPLTGYTGHVQQDSTGLIYMRGRFYSPAWHRFVNSDQGVDPNNLNQMSYVGGNPFHSTDPSGMLELIATYQGESFTFSSWTGFYSWLASIGNPSYNVTSGVYASNSNVGYVPTPFPAWEQLSPIGPPSPGNRGGGGGVGSYAGKINSPAPQPQSCGNANGVYRQNRLINSNVYASNFNPITHTFVFTTDAQGRVANTYSWGNAANTRGWTQNSPEDIKAATNALQNSWTLQRVGGTDLIPRVQKVYNELSRRQYDHVNQGVAYNCKFEADKLLFYAISSR